MKKDRRRFDCFCVQYGEIGRSRTDQTLEQALAWIHEEYEGQRVNVRSTLENSKRGKYYYGRIFIIVCVQ